MTNLEALQATVPNYPLGTNTFLKVLADRDVTSTATYGGKSRAFDLATADLYVILASSPNVSEGGYSVSIPERAELRKMADGIYQKWGQSNQSSGKIKAVTPW